MKPPEKVYLPKKVYLIDTNVILRYLLGDHAEFSPKAESFMLNVSEGTKKAEILDVVIVECIYVMEKYYQIPKTEIVGKLSGILNFSNKILMRYYSGITMYSKKWLITIAA